MSDCESETEVKAPAVKLNKNGRPRKRVVMTEAKLENLAKARAKYNEMRSTIQSATAREKELKKKEKELRTKNLSIREEAVKKLEEKLQKKEPKTVLTGTEDAIVEPVINMTEDEEEEETEEVISKTKSKSKPKEEVKVKSKKPKKKVIVVESESESEEDSSSDEEVTMTKKQLKAMLKSKKEKKDKVTEPIEQPPKEYTKLPIVRGIKNHNPKDKPVIDDSMAQLYRNLFTNY